MLGTRRGNFDSSLCEPGPQAIYTEDGIVLIYNGKNSNPNNGSGDPMLLDGAYCPGQALFDKNDLARVIERTPTYFMNPEKDYNGIRADLPANRRFHRHDANDYDTKSGRHRGLHCQRVHMGW